MSSFELRFNKSFVGTSKNGAIFHWLKSTFLPCKKLEDVMITAVSLLYTPKFLASLPQSDELVFREVALSRNLFQGLMNLVAASPPAARPLPKRVKISFSQSFDPDSKSGQTFEWLVGIYQEKTAEKIVQAVQWLYYPATLAAEQETAGLAEQQVERSRRLFEEFMTEAILESNPTAIALIANRLDQSYVTSPSHQTKQTSLVVQPSREKPPPTHSLEGSHSAAEDFEDDFIEVDRTLDVD
jgi:hypothetical protein